MQVSEAPERIWAGRADGFGGWHEGPDFVNDIEYIRADKVYEWSPIETAPNDGTAILGYCPSAWCNTTGFIFVMCYDPDLEGWAVDFPESQSWDEVSPVAWMPLPTPPMMRERSNAVE